MNINHNLQWGICLLRVMAGWRGRCPCPRKQEVEFATRTALWVFAGLLPTEGLFPPGLSGVMMLLTATLPASASSKKFLHSAVSQLNLRPLQSTGSITTSSFPLSPRSSQLSQRHKTEGWWALWASLWATNLVTLLRHFRRITWATPCSALCWIQDLPTWLGILLRNAWEPMAPCHPRHPPHFLVFWRTPSTPMPAFCPQEGVTPFLSDLFALLSASSPSPAPWGLAVNHTAQPSNTTQVFT